MQSQQLKKLNIPDKSGVYFFMKGRDILYIGKATSLRDRTKSYFGKDLISTRGPLLVDMVFKADNLKWQETDSVLEALILEANLIKKYQPVYNTKEKDNKSFNYVCITRLNLRMVGGQARDELPTILIVRGRSLEQKKYSKVFGPFPNGGQLKEALRLIRKIFPFVDEKSRIKGTYEFYRQIKLVPEQKEILLQNIKNIKLLFEGKKKSILKNLEKEMKSYAKARAFEKAGEIKRQIFALQHIQDISLIKEDVLQNSSHSSFRIEAYDIAHMSGKNMVGVMVVLENGEPAKNEYRKFKIKNYTNSNDVGALSEVLERRFKHVEWRAPDLIVVDGSTAQINATKKVLKSFALDIPLVSVVKDDRHRAKAIKGNVALAQQHESAILLANSEAHRFAIGYHKQMRNKNFFN